MLYACKLKRTIEKEVGERVGGERGEEGEQACLIKLGDQACYHLFLKVLIGNQPRTGFITADNSVPNTLS